MLTCEFCDGLSTLALWSTIIGYTFVKWPLSCYFMRLCILKDKTFETGLLADESCLRKMQVASLMVGGVKFVGIVWDICWMRDVWRGTLLNDNVEWCFVELRILVDITLLNETLFKDDCMRHILEEIVLETLFKEM